MRTQHKIIIWNNFFDTNYKRLNILIQKLVSYREHIFQKEVIRYHSCFLYSSTFVLLSIPH